jgi:hypothetical protein
MTILEASAKLYQWFSKNDCVRFSHSSPPKPDNFKEIVVLTDDEQADRAALLLALQGFERGEVVKSHTVGQNTFWVLIKPFAAYDQTINIDPNLAVEISKVINEFCDRIKDKTDYCDPSRVMSADIRSLVLIITHFLSLEAPENSSEED